MTWLAEVRMCHPCAGAMLLTLCLDGPVLFLLSPGHACFKGFGSFSFFLRQTSELEGFGFLWSTGSPPTLAAELREAGWQEEEGGCILWSGSRAGGPELGGVRFAVRAGNPRLGGRFLWSSGSRAGGQPARNP